MSSRWTFAAPTHRHPAIFPLASETLVEPAITLIDDDCLSVFERMTLGPPRPLIFKANSHTPCNRCVRFVTTVATDHATLATQRTLLLTWAGLSPAGSHQLAAGALIQSPRRRGRAGSAGFRGRALWQS